MPKTVVLYTVWHGKAGEGEYDDTAVSYDKFTDLMRDARVALDVGRKLLIEREVVTVNAYASEWGPKHPDDVNPLLGKMR